MRVNKVDGSFVLFTINDIKDIKFVGPYTSTEDLKKMSGVLDAFNKLKCYPNPTNSRVTIEYYLPESGIADLYIYNNSGNMIYKKLLEDQFAGNNTTFWSGIDNGNNSLPSGIYHCCIIFKNTKLQEKIIILK
jgi:hypothetical protein